MEVAQENDQQLFESSIRALEAQIANIGLHLTIDASTRQAYARQVHAMSSELRMMAKTGRITWSQAAEQASESRNLIMEVIRARSTPVGLAIAQKLKQQGRTLNEIVALKSKKLYGATALFNKLTAQQQNKVYLEVVKSAGKSRPEVTSAMEKLSHVGRGLILLSVALSVYTVATADNRYDAAGKEIAITGAGVGGGIAGGAIAGLACGPGAPVCVTVGAFVGGALAAFGVGFFW